MLDPADRVVMVSGAARGIGRAVVERLLADGFRVSAGVRTSNLTSSDRLLVHRYDAESLESAQAWRDATLARFGALHGLVNAAGVSLARAPRADAVEDALDSVWLIKGKAPRGLGPRRARHRDLPGLRGDRHDGRRHRVPARGHDQARRHRRADRDGPAAARDGQRCRAAGQLPPGELVLMRQRRCACPAVTVAALHGQRGHG